MASFSGGSDDAVFGVRPDATDGFDPAYDIPEPPAPPEPPFVRAYFYYPTQDLKRLHRSCIASGSTLVWDNLTIEYSADDPTSMTLSWDVSAIPTGFNVYLYQYPGPSLVADMRAVNNYTYTASPGTTKFKVIATILAAPPAPSLISPENGAELLDNTPTFEWTLEDPSGVTYQIQIDDDEDFSSPVYSAVDLTETTITLPDEYALALGKYYWRVRAVSSDITGEWSEEWNFRVVPIGAIGAILMPLLMLLPFALMLRRQNRRCYSTVGGRRRWVIDAVNLSAELSRPFWSCLRSR